MSTYKLAITLLHQSKEDDLITVIVKALIFAIISNNFSFFEDLTELGVCLFHFPTST
ncbi:hypothetical protein Syun_014961 [Stephania yunnanensis]|uniref:Uncharacterized protein n=1 Tax=Stephania yunnanensis TaxID=152371 RepID=A0AAP0JLD7_9MAGN